MLYYFADRVITENKGKKAIIGTFSIFHSPVFPITFPPWFIYASVSNIDEDGQNYDEAYNSFCDFFESDSDFYMRSSSTR